MNIIRWKGLLEAIKELAFVRSTCYRTSSSSSWCAPSAWISLTLSRHISLSSMLPAGLQEYLPYLHRAAVCRFELVVQLINQPNNQTTNQITKPTNHPTISQASKQATNQKSASKPTSQPHTILRSIDSMMISVLLSFEAKNFTKASVHFLLLKNYRQISAHGLERIK